MSSPSSRLRKNGTARFRFSPLSVLMVVMLKTCSILVLNLLLCSALGAAEDYPVGNQPFRRYVEKVRDGHYITFYLSTQQAPSPVPLIVWVQGTGCSSQFVSVGGRMSRGLQGVLNSVARDRARILAVEKPGVEYLDDHPDDSDASACRPEFRAEFTLDRWATTIAVIVISRKSRTPYVLHYEVHDQA